MNVPRLLKAPDDAALSAVITNGVPGGAMPGTRMTPEENRQLAAYVRTLSGQARKDAVSARTDTMSNPPPQTQTVREPVKPADSAQQ